MCLQRKKVHWSVTREEHRMHDSPKSWTSPLRGATPPTPYPPTVTLPLTAAPDFSFPSAPFQRNSESWTSQSCRLPPTPYLATIPLPPWVHNALSPAHGMRLDFGAPSKAFRRNPQLTRMLLDEPACRPPRAVIIVHIAAGVVKVNIEIKHNPSGHAVTVGDILSAIQHRLHMYDRKDVPPETSPYVRRRIEPVNSYCNGRHWIAEAHHVAAKSEGNGRLVDQLLGNTLFAGMEPREGKPDNHWKINLEKPRRYPSQ